MDNTGRLILYTVLATAMVVAAAIGRVAAGNSDLLIVYTIVRPFVFLISSCFLVLGIAFLINKRLFSTVPLLMIGVFFFSFLSVMMPVSAYSNLISGAIVGGLVLLILYSVRNAEPFEIAKKSTLFFAALVLPFMPPVVSVALQSAPPVVSQDFKAYVETLLSEQVDPAQLPDIIYVVPDRYASRKTLKTVYDVDNEPFYSDLRKRGFVVNSNARANYPTTAHSLASTHNSGYLDAFAEVYGPQTGRVQPLYNVIENSEAQKATRRLGYSFVNAGSWWDGTRYNRLADANYGTYLEDGFSRLLVSEIEALIIQNTPLPALVDVASVFYGSVECKRIKRKLDWLGEVGNRSKPMFVLAHMTVPHDPIVANGEGRCYAKPRGRYPMPGHSFARHKRDYADYLRYFNAAVLEIFDRQIALRRKSGRGLIFVIQSDEGPYPKQTMAQGNKKTIADLSNEDLKTKIGSINAIYMNGDTTIQADELKTPINNWRIILERLTGKPLARKEHKVFIYKDHAALYEFTEVGPELFK